MVIESIDRFMVGKEKGYRQFDEEGMQPGDYVDELKLWDFSSWGDQSILPAIVLLRSCITVA